MYSLFLERGIDFHFMGRKLLIQVFFSSDSQASFLLKLNLSRKFIIFKEDKKKKKIKKEEEEEEEAEEEEEEDDDEKFTVL